MNLSTESCIAYSGVTWAGRGIPSGKEGDDSTRDSARPFEPREQLRVRILHDGWKRDNVDHGYVDKSMVYVDGCRSSVPCHSRSVSPVFLFSGVTPFCIYM